MFINPLGQSYWRQQKQLVLNKLSAIIEDREYTDENEKIYANVRRSMKIKNFQGSENEELRYDRNFEMNCVVLSQYVNQPIKTCTTVEYFTIMKMHNDKIEQQKK